MSEKHITRVSLEEARRRRSRTDWDKFDADDVENADDEGFVPDWTKVRVVVPEPKQSVTLRVDPDVLAFFKADGKGYQTRMNAVLRTYMEAVKARHSGS
jgi:uncharacterized protein (DUF4415 family)